MYRDSSGRDGETALSLSTHREPIQARFLYSFGQTHIVSGKQFSGTAHVLFCLGTTARLLFHGFLQLAFALGKKGLIVPRGDNT